MSLREDTKAKVRVLRDLLALADKDVSNRTLLKWTEEERKQAEKWAALTHLRASDNNVRVPPEPEHVKPLPAMLKVGLWPMTRYSE